MECLVRQEEPLQSQEEAPKMALCYLEFPKIVWCVGPAEKKKIQIKKYLDFALGDLIQKMCYQNGARTAENWCECVQFLSHGQLFVTPCNVSLSFTTSQSFLKLMFTKSVLTWK